MKSASGKKVSAEKYDFQFTRILPLSCRNELVSFGCSAESVAWQSCMEIKKDNHGIFAFILDETFFVSNLYTKCNFVNSKKSIPRLCKFPKIMIFPSFHVLVLVVAPRKSLFRGRRQKFCAFHLFYLTFQKGLIWGYKNIELFALANSICLNSRAGKAGRIKKEVEFMVLSTTFELDETLNYHIYEEL